MLKVRFVITVLTAFNLSGLHAECIYPEDVPIPDGAASTYEEMRDGQTYVKEYMADMEAFLECLKKEADEAPASAAGEVAVDQNRGDENDLLQRRLEAIDAMEAVAAKFNEQVRAYKLANP
jgi:hypothetical protein